MAPRSHKFALATAVLLALSACASPDAATVDTSSSPAPGTPTTGAPTTSAPTTPTAVPAAALDLGSFSATASKVPAVVAGEEAGEVAEGYRLAEYVVDPYDFDHKLTKPGAPSTVIADGQTLLDMYYYTAPLKQWVTGFGATRRTEDSAEEISSSVLLYRTPDQAAKAARGLHAEYLKSSDESGRHPRKITLGAHPRALVTTKTNYGTRDVTAVESSGGALLIVYATSKSKSFAALQPVVAKVLARQMQLLGQFRRSARVTALPVDPKRLLAKTLAVDAKGTLAPMAFSGGPLTAAHFATEPQGITGILRAAGVDAIAVNRAAVLRAGSPAQAQRLHAELVGLTKSAYAVAAPPKGLGQAACFSLKRGQPGLRAAFSCQIAVDRYVAQVSAKSLREAQQVISAQYLVLTGG